MIINYFFLIFYVGENSFNQLYKNIRLLSVNTYLGILMLKGYALNEFDKFTSDDESMNVWS